MRLGGRPTAPHLYLADGEPKGTQVFVRWMDAEGASFSGDAPDRDPTDAKWAPDGKGDRLPDARA